MDTEPPVCLTVVMPCFNEIGTISEIVDRVLAVSAVGEVVIVDDGSTDGTRDWLAGVNDSRIRVICHETNSGKGAALRTGFQAASQRFVIVQDADLEYDPCDYPTLLQPLLSGQAQVVYGSRFRGGDASRVLYFWHSVGNKFLTTLSNMFTNLNLSDMETCYKVFDRKLLTRVEIEENRFGFEPEVTAKVAELGAVIFEVGISYNGRTYADGKKIGWRDGVHAVFCIVAYSPAGRRRRLNRASPFIGRLLGRPT